VGRSRAGTLLAGSIAIAFLAGCGSTPAPGPSGASAEPSPGAAAFGPADAQRTVDDLARLGIETRVRPSDSAPITAVTGESSAVRLLRLQVRNLALERAGGGGTTGADLDAVTAAGGGGPVSALLAGWAAAGTTPAATWAASLLPGDPSADPTSAVFPTLAVLAFVADANAGSGGVSSRPSNLLTVSSDFCGEVSAYLSGALGDIVDATADPPAWLKQLIDQYAPQYANDTALLRRTIGAVALLSYATSLARPWTVSLVPDPAATAYGIEGQDPVEGGVDLTVLSGADVFADDIADCASLADAQLASVPVEGSTVVWDASGLDGHATEATATSAVDDLGTAGMSYVMTTESQDDAQNGDPVSAQMSVNAWVDRAEMADLAAVVKSILLGDAAGSPAGPTVKALYQGMEPTLNTVMRPSGFALIDVTYHQPKATPSPSQAESGLTGTWDGTWVIDGYGNTGGFTMELVQTGSSFSGPVQITNTDCSNGMVDGTVDGTSVTFGWLLSPQPVQFTGVLDGSSMSGTWSAYACSDATLFLTGTWEATRR
jgi:hypothetical protein